MLDPGIHKRHFEVSASEVIRQLVKLDRSESLEQDPLESKENPGRHA
jgi:hypothetical protein